MSIDRAASIIAARKAARLEPARPVLPPAGYVQAPPTLPPVCPDCYGIGVIPHPGSTLSTECPCGALLAGHVARWAHESGIPRRHQHDGGFEAYKVASTAHGRILARCRDYAAAFTPGAPGLILAGPPGGGKTHLAAAITWASIHRRRTDGTGYCTARFWNVPQLLMEIRATYQPNAEDHESDIIERATGADLLVLDDLGAERATDHAGERLFTILNDRLETNRTTIITTNLNPDGKRSLAHLGPRLYSRLGEIAPRENVLHLNLPDHRRGPKT